MKSFNLKSHLNFNAEKKFVPCLNEYYQELAVIDFDEVYEGYKITCSKVESKNTEGRIYYEANSNVVSSTSNSPAYTQLTIPILNVSRVCSLKDMQSIVLL